MSKTLIIKRVSNEFDSFVCQHIKESKNNINVCDAFLFKGKIGRKIVKIIKQYNVAFLLPFVLKISKASINEYNDVILFDDYPDLPLIKWIYNNCPKVKIKLWFWNVPNYSIEVYRKYCELYCFDIEYCNRNKVHFINQFYFEKLVDNYSCIETNYDIVYVGVDKNRKELLLQLAEVFNNAKLSYKIKLITSNINDLKLNYDNFEVIDKPLSYEEVLEICSKSKTILELVHENQMGLTWRALEALFFKKKMITNNKKIKEYDFYDKRNIFIYGEDSLSELKDFCNGEYVNKDEYLEEYSFSKWYQKIESE